MSTTDQLNRKYERNYLTDVIFRVDFPKILDLDLREPTADFQKEIFERFPIMEEKENANLALTVGPDKIETKKEDETLWRFTTKDKNKKVFISPKHISIEYSKYDTFEELSSDIELVFRAFIKLYPVAIANRIGLRYVNQIEIKEGNPFDWDKLLDPALISTINGFTPNNGNIRRAMHLLEIKEGDYNFKFQYGMFNSGYPNPISRKEFILDYDCSIRNVDINEAAKTAEESNKIIKKWFEKSICEGLREILGVKDGS